jgi:hypothetical protein
MNQSSLDPRDAYANLPSIPDADDKSYEDLERALRDVVFASPEVKSLCLNPELGSSDPNYLAVTGNVRVPGIDLDGRATGQGDSGQDESAAPGSCPHVDLAGLNGEVGIDNQYYRVVGCNKGYQPSGQANSFNISQLTGAWGILIKLRKVDDIQNDEHVEVNIYANGDPIMLSPAREPLGYATYTAHQEPRFRAQTWGYIADGVLYTEPVDVRIPHDINAMYTDRALRDARLQVTIGEDGSVEGYLAGYAPVDVQYDLEYGFRQAKVDTSETSELGPLRLRMLSGIGRAGALGYTCEGVYYALREHADGHPDPETGECTSISTQYQIQAIPAFVMDDTGNE